jgi:Spy/CpxP family protein refolding chaperone
MRKSVTSALIGLIAMLAVEGALAQGGWKELPPGKWWTNTRLIVQLRLSPDQQSRIDGLWTQNRRNLIDLKAEMERRQLDFTELLTKDAIDEEAALKAFDRFQEVKLNIERATFLMRIRIKNQLSAEQQQKLEAISELLRQQRARGGAASAAESGIPVVKK